MTATDTAAVLVETGLAKAKQIQILMSKGLTKEEAEATLATAAHTAATAAGTATTNLFSGALAKAKVAAKGLYATLAAHPFLMVATAITVLIAGATALSKIEGKLAEEAKEASDASLQDAKSKKEESDKISELINKYKELAKNDAQDVNTRIEIRKIQEEITGLVGKQADNLNLVNGKLDEEIDKLHEIQNIELSKTISAYEKAYVDASEATASYDMHNAHWAMDMALAGQDNVLTIDYWGDNENRDKALKIINDVWQENGYGSAYRRYVEYI